MFTLNCRPCHVGAAVDAAVERTRLVLERCMVIVSVPDNIAVVADECALTRAVENLLRSAARHSPPDTVVWVLAEHTRGGVVVSVEGRSAFRVRLPAVPVAGVRRPAPVAFLHSAP